MLNLADFWRYPFSDCYCLEHLMKSLIETIAVSESWEVLRILSKADATTREPGDSHSSAGILENVKQYFVCRALMYCDAFTVSNPLLSKGSVGGCYMISLSLPYGTVRNGQL